MISPLLAHPARRPTLLAVVLIFVGSTLMACGGEGASSTNSTADGKTKISVADQVGSEVDYAAFWIALGKGYFDEEGIEIDRKTYANGPEAMLHFANGEVDAVMGGLAPFMQSAAQGQDFVMLMSLTKGNAPLVGNTSVDSFSDLDGGTVGTPGVGTVQDALLTHMAEEEGIDFKRVYAKVTDFVPMVQKGEIDAFIAWEPAAATAIGQNDQLHYILQRPLEPLEDAESLELIIQRDVADEDRDAVVGFVRAYLRAIEDIRGMAPAEIAEETAKASNQPDQAEVFENALRSVTLTEPRIDMESTDLILKTAAAGGKIPEDMVEDTDAFMNEYLDYSYLEEAEKGLEGS
jgi:NitT/TauT family transport system substrate-binding protein